MGSKTHPSDRQLPRESKEPCLDGEADLGAALARLCKPLRQRRAPEPPSQHVPDAASAAGSAHAPSLVRGAQLLMRNLSSCAPAIINASLLSGTYTASPARMFTVYKSCAPVIVALAQAAQRESSRKGGSRAELAGSERAAGRASTPPARAAGEEMIVPSSALPAMPTPGYSKLD